MPVAPAPAPAAAPTLPSTPAPATPAVTPPKAEAPAPETPPAKEPDAKEERAEQLGEVHERIRAAFKDRLRGKETELKEEDLKQPTKPKAEEAKKEEPKKEEEPAKAAEPETPRATRVKKGKSDIEVAAEATRTAAEATRIAAEALKAKPETRKPTPAEVDEEAHQKLLAQLPEGYRADVPVLEVMEKRLPEKYKGLVRRYAEAALRTQQYQQKWEEENPGQAFNPQDEAHDRFFSQNDVHWDERDYGRTLAYMEAEPLLEEERKKNQKFQEELRLKETLREAEPQIRQRQAEEARAMLAAIDKESVGLVDSHGQVVKAEFDRLDEKDPVKAEVLSKASQDLTGFVDQVERIFHPSGAFGFDEKNQAHIKVAEYVLEKEQQMSRLSAEDRQDSEGRMWASRRDYATMSAAQRASHWQFGAPEIITLRRHEVAEFVKQAITEGHKRLEMVAARYGFMKKAAPEAAPAQAETPKPKAEEPKAEPAKAAPAPTSPSGGGEPKVDTLADGKNTNSGDWRQMLKQGLRGNTVV